MDIQEICQRNKLFETITGSRAYGTNTPTSDWDCRGVYSNDLRDVLSLFPQDNEVSIEGQDHKLMELRKFLKLLKDANPNILEQIFIEERFWKYCHPVFKKYVVDRRQMFLSKKVMYTFTGYAAAQLHRMKSHKKWIANPHSETPPRLWNYLRFIDVGGLERVPEKDLLMNSSATKIDHTHYKLYVDDLGRLKKGFLFEDSLNPSFIDIDERKLREDGIQFQGTVILNIDQFQADLGKWKKYWEWKKNRNEERAVLEEKHAVDTKHAYHLIRLCRMAKEILSQGKCIVFRPDAEELLAIRNGAWSYEKIVEYAENMDAEVKVLAESSILPYGVDQRLVDDLYVEMVEELWGINLNVGPGFTTR